MSKIISFSSDDKFCDGLDDLIEESGYQNRSRFLRDAALHFAEVNQRGDLSEMESDLILEGHLIIYYQHGIESKLLHIRHSSGLDVTVSTRGSLKHSHTCVDMMQAIGSAEAFRGVIAELKDTPSVDKVVFVSAPMREDGCC